MARREGNTECSLWNHTAFLGILDGRNDVAHIVQTAEDTGNVDTLFIFHLVHQLTYIGRNRIHAEAIQTAVQHVCLDTRIMQRLGESTNSLVRVFTVQKVHLFKSTPIGFHTSKASHFYNHRSYTGQLVGTWLIFTRGLPHIAVDQTELDFFLHN